jgi:hypothetical protein
MCSVNFPEISDGMEHKELLYSKTQGLIISHVCAAHQTSYFNIMQRYFMNFMGIFRTLSVTSSVYEYASAEKLRFLCFPFCPLVNRSFRMFVLFLGVLLCNTINVDLMY